MGEPVEKFGVGGALALGTEIVWGGDDAAAEVLLPDAVDDDAGEEVAGAVFGIGDPIGEGVAAMRGAGVFGGRLLPEGFGFPGPGEDLEEALGGDFLLLVDIAAVQDVGIG